MGYCKNKIIKDMPTAIKPLLNPANTTSVSLFSPTACAVIAKPAVTQKF